jgi:DnaJ family protein C protein 3
LQGGHGKDALKACNEALDMDPENANILCDRAEAHIANEDYEAGRCSFNSLLPNDLS